MILLINLSLSLSLMKWHTVVRHKFDDYEARRIYRELLFHPLGPITVEILQCKDCGLLLVCECWGQCEEKWCQTASDSLSKICKTTDLGSDLVMERDKLVYYQVALPYHLDWSWTNECHCQCCVLNIQMNGPDSNSSIQTATISYCDSWNFIISLSFFFL